MTKTELLDELHLMGGGPLWAISDLQAMCADMIVYHDRHSGRVFIELSDGLAVAPAEPTPLYADRFNVDMSKVMWDDAAMRKATHCIETHEHAAELLTRMASGQARKEQSP